MALAEHLLLEGQQNQTMLRLREELEAAHDTVAVKTRERMGLLDEIQGIRWVPRRDSSVRRPCAFGGPNIFRTHAPDAVFAAPAGKCSAA